MQQYLKNKNNKIHFSYNLNEYILINRKNNDNCLTSVGILFVSYISFHYLKCIENYVVSMIKIFISLFLINLLENLGNRFYKDDNML